MGEHIEIKSTAPDGFMFGAYHAAPSGASRGGVIVVQEIFGIDENIRRDVDRWAALGFEAVAPSLFDRRERGYVSGHDTEGFASGIGHAQATPLDQALADIAACRDHLAPRGKVYIVGYCYGGSMAWLAAGKLDGLSGASSYYGSMVQANATLTPRCPTIVHLGRLDTFIPADEVKAAVQSASPQTPVHIYEDVGHGFNNADCESADLARRRTLEIFDA